LLATAVVLPGASTWTHAAAAFSAEKTKGKSVAERTMPVEIAFPDRVATTEPASRSVINGWDYVNQVRCSF